MKNGENLEPLEVSSAQQERNFEIKEKFASSMNWQQLYQEYFMKGLCCWVRNEYRRLWGFQSFSSADSSSFAELPVVTVSFTIPQNPQISNVWFTSAKQLIFKDIRQVLLSFSVARDANLWTE